MQLIRTVCDLCYSESVISDVVATRLVGIDKRLGLVEVCDVHDKALTVALEPFFAASRKPERKPRATSAPSDTVPDDDDKYHCTDADCARTFKTESGMRRHVTRMH